MAIVRGRSDPTRPSIPVRRRRSGLPGRAASGWWLALVLALTAGAAGAPAAEPSRPFSQTLSQEQKERLGLAGLSAGQLAELDAAVRAYASGEISVAVQQAVQQVERRTAARMQEAERKTQAAEQKAVTAAGAAVEEYRKKQEPGVIARTLAAFKQRQEEDRQERFTARVVGPFRGWSGGTYFPLENGQVWKQVGTESYELPVRQDAEVEIYQSRNGYWRLRYDGAWITVKRLQ